MKNRKITALLVALIAVAGIVMGVFGGEAWASKKYNCFYSGSNITSPKQCAYNIADDFHFSLSKNESCHITSNASNTEKEKRLGTCKSILARSDKVEFKPGTSGGAESDTTKDEYIKNVATVLVEVSPYTVETKKALINEINKVNVSGADAKADAEPPKSDDDGDEDTPNKEEAIDAGAMKPGKCTSIMGDDYCSDKVDANGDSGIMRIIKMVINIMTGGVVVAGTIGIVICGYLWLTARDNEQQMMKAKTRLIEVVIGLVAWVLMAVLLQFILPDSGSSSEAGISKTEQVVSREDIG